MENWDLQRKRAVRIHTLLDGKAPHPKILLIARAYLWGVLEKPLEKLTDKEILAVQDFGPKTLEAIRAVIPPPQEKA